MDPDLDVYKMNINQFEEPNLFTKMFPYILLINYQNYIKKSFKTYDCIRILGGSRKARDTLGGEHVTPSAVRT
jgi:hypothetical protein